MKHRPRLADPAALEIEPAINDAEFRAELDSLAALETRLRNTCVRRDRAKARARGQKTTRSAIERAKDLLAGGQVPSGANPGAEVEACDQEEFEILRPAIAAQIARVDELRSALSFTAANKLRAPHEAALLRAYHALEDLAAAIDATLVISTRLRAAGYDERYDVLPLLVPHVLAVHSRPDLTGSAAWSLRRELQQRGLL
jgi:hypothetical protein